MNLSKRHRGTSTENETLEACPIIAGKKWPVTNNTGERKCHGVDVLKVTDFRRVNCNFC